MFLSNPIFNPVSYQLNPYSVAPILVAALTLIFGFFLENLEKKSEFNRAIFYFSISSSLWLLASAFMLNAKTYVVAAFWTHFLYAGFLIVPVTLYHLSVNLTNRYNSQKYIILFKYLVVLAFIPLCRAPFFVSGVKLNDFGYYPIAGFLQLLLVVFIGVCCSASILNLLTYHFKMPEGSLDRRRMRLFLFSFIIVLFSYMDILATYDFYVYPSGFIGFLGFMVGITFFKLTFYHNKIERHSQVLEEEVAVKTKKLSEIVDELQKTQFKLVETGKKSALASLSAGILHQISQPITAIHGFVRFIKKEMKEKDPFYKPICHIEEQSIYIKKMLEDLMNLVRHREIVKEDVDINEVIERAVGLLTDELRIRRVRWDLELASGLPVINGDPIHLQQVFMNMIINAMYSFDDLPTGKFRSIKIISKSSEPNNEVHVCFEDTGPKLSEEDKEILFEPFFSTKAKQSGVGLALCQDLMAEHEGCIEIGSNTDNGRSFILHFPLTPVDV